MVAVKQFTLSKEGEIDPSKVVGRIAIFDEDGNPVELDGDGSPSVAWADVTGKPATFPPATHTHTVANVTGLQAALDAKATSAALAALTARVDALEAAGA